MTTPPSDFFTLRGRNVRVDAMGRVSLSDLHRAGGFRTNARPHDWLRLATTQTLIQAVLSKVTGKSRNWAKSDYQSVLYTKVGAADGTFADSRLALSYAEYLSPALALEVREVFLRYKAGDATLADEILQKAPPADNEWAGMRALGRAERNRLTAVLKDHEVTKPQEYGRVTNATYAGLFDRTAQQLKAAKGLGKSQNLRDAMSTKELVFTMAAEHLAAERIEEQDARGVVECSDAARRSANFIRQAIEADRADRKKPAA
ncbi:KilA-N domain-containing protein [Alsobacter sp. R-9]